MKSFIYVLLFLFLFVEADLYAGSKRTRVDLDVKGTEIVRADLGVDDHYYYIDTTACICWVSRLIGGANSTSTFDCSKLSAHQKLEQHIKKCLPPKEVSVVLKELEVVKEETVVLEPVGSEVEVKKTEGLKKRK